MVTLSVTRSRVADALDGAQALLEAKGWDPLQYPVAAAIDEAAGYVPGKGAPDAEQITLDAWDALVAQLGDQCIEEWEKAPGRTQLQVLTALQGAAKAVAR
ncbi:hypothetical protein GCM10010317_077880 [Streptomyces mirabilis]|uniref:DUF6197 family protein n=1 Tax=Streptomyces mirabilis TaxID=68239 RepID=UPI00167EF0F9|nr:hypothetical protein [Streptomyces mirabilis]GHD70491.1 hypothetical protein GCM10010317_077880 [Streptomyces mirabilis]